MSFTILAALTACTTPAPEPAPEPVEEPQPEPEGTPGMEHPGPDWEVRLHMNEHFAFATDALFFAFQGNLEGLHGEARKLAEHEPIKEAPESWAPYLETMKIRSKELAATKNIEDASRGLVKVAETCAACHAANKGPDVSHKDLITNPELFGEKAMDRHQWAAYLLWIGLIVPDDEIWMTGTKALSHPKGALPELPDTVEPLELRVHDLAARAAKVETGEARSEVFADFITTCAECHTTLGVKMP